MGTYLELGDLKPWERDSIMERFAIAGDVYNDKPDPSKALTGRWSRVFSSSEITGMGDKGFYGALYQRSLNGRTENVIAFRGFDGASDLDDVARLAIGQTPKQFFDAYRFTKIVTEKFGIDPADVDYAGHSMGGYLAKAVGILNGTDKISSFNGPGLFPEDLQRLPRLLRREFNENKADITEEQVLQALSVNARFDLVNGIGVLQGNRIQISTTGAQHKLSSLERSFDRAVMHIQPEATAATVKPEKREAVAAMTLG